MTKEFNNIDEIQKYYDVETSNYNFRENGEYIDVKLAFTLRCDGGIFVADIDAKDIFALYMNAKNVNARDVSMTDIVARDIDVRDINCARITARDIYARDICVGEVIAGDINAAYINTSANIKSSGDIYIKGE